MVRQRTALRFAPSTTVEPVGLEVRNLPKPVTSPVLFGDDHPLEVEIGTGKGTFLLAEASRRPEVNFLGLERARRYWRHASDRLRRRECWNARVVLTEAGYFLTEFIPDASVHAIHVHFPDPWPKKRHHKRRLIQPRFVREVERVLTAGGRLQIVTDHADYHAQIEETIRGSRLTRDDYVPPAAVDDEGLLVGSNFERKYHRLGKNFYAIAAVKS